MAGACFLVGWFVVPSAAGQAPTPVETQAQLQAAQELMARATAEFDGTQQSRSIVLFDDLIARLESWRRQGGLPPRGREMLVQAYELRGRAYFNIGLPDKAKDSFRALISVDPGHGLSKDRVSPKIVDFFNNVKKDLVGHLAVSSRPAGAKVSVNGEFLSLTDFFPVDILAGDYTVEIARPGYRTETRTLTVAPRATETLQVELTRTAASFFFVTEPAGVEIWIDGEMKAVTSGSLAPDLQEAVRAKGLDPARASARLEVGELALGTHGVEFKKKCYEPVRRPLEVAEAQDFEAEPVRLAESVASLKLTSDPPGAQIFVDGEPAGVTPRQLDAVCAGPHRLEVKHASGKFIQDVTLGRGETLSLDCPIRPSLSFLGVVADSPAGERIASEVTEKLVANLSKIRTLNFVPAPREIVERLLGAEQATRHALVPGGGSDPEAIRRLSEKLATALEAQGVLIALLPEERLQRTAILHLLAAGNAVSDPWAVAFAESPSYGFFISAVDQKTTVYRPWTGLVTVDTLLHDGVPVLRVVAGSPAALAGIQVGDILYGADGQPVKRTATFLDLVAAKKPRDKVSLQLRNPAGVTRAVEVSLGETPQEIPLNDPTLLYNKVMMDLRQQADGYPGTEAAAFARLDLALCAMHFGDFAAAHEHLLKARTELPQRPGLSQGTALYYLGLSLERLGYKREAAEAYRAAAGFKEATLVNNDGPAVAPLAARRAAALQ